MTIITLRPLARLTTTRTRCSTAAKMIEEDSAPKTVNCPVFQRIKFSHTIYQCPSPHTTHTASSQITTKKTTKRLSAKSISKKPSRFTPLKAPQVPITTPNSGARTVNDCHIHITSSHRTDSESQLNPRVLSRTLR